MQNVIDNIFNALFNEKNKLRIEIATLYVASIGFIVHLILVFLNIYEIVSFPDQLDGLLSNPISAIYTPFSFILFYEVFLLIYYLPNSFSIAIAKQYEIVSLILIRRIFKDISYLDFSNENFDVFEAENISLLYDSVGFILIFFLIFLFRYLLVKKRQHTITQNIQGFINFKKLICVLLFPALIIMSVYSFGNWVIEIDQLNAGLISEITDFNKIFYHDFFAVLIIVDVLILIASFRYTDRYSLLIRNTGFVITTVLIRVSFSSNGLGNFVLLVSGIAFGVLILYIYSLYDKIDKGESTKESYAYL
jgi:hypothetical protein